MKKSKQDMPLMETGDGNIVLFHPHIPESAIEMVSKTLRTRWIGQGPNVDAFERAFSARFGNGLPSIAVGQYGNQREHRELRN